MDAEGVWYQLNKSRPDFFKSWQAMALASSTMLESDMLSNMYSYQAFEYFFTSEVNVRLGVLREFSPEQADMIYGDSKYGLNSVDTIMIWVIAADGNENDKTDARAFLLEYFYS